MSAREVIAGSVLSVCSDGNSDICRTADTIISALSAAGYAIVPREPTEAMRKVAVLPFYSTNSGGELDCTPVWSAMLSASEEKLK